MRIQKLPNLAPLVASVTGSMAIAVGALWAVRHLASLEWFRANNEVAGNYLQTLGTIYAVLLAFVVFVVWQQHNEARDAVEREANELADLHRILCSFEPKGGPSMQLLTRAYQAAVVELEWTAMANGQASPHAEQALEELWAGLRRIEPRSSREESLYHEALARFNDLGDARSHRLFCSRLRLPPTLWILLIVNGGLTVGSMGLFGLESFTAHALMTAALAGSIAFILYLVADLDNPFWGDWRISTEPFHNALRRGELGTEKPPLAELD
jgi:Protein of unknown function (DUF4239)